MEPRAGTVVIGIGNEFRRDDGVGWAVVALLRERAALRPPSRGTVLAQSDGDPGRLIGLWEDTALTVVVDACFPPSARPGRTHRWAADPDGYLRSAAAGRQSTHGLGLAEALRLARCLGRMPERLVVYAVEGADGALGEGLTSAVAAAVPLLARRVEEDVTAFLRVARRVEDDVRGTRRTAFRGRRPPD
ncbi:hydrogenase maturation protease [Streptomyces sp. NPDC058739]|uniref:hydrogenase maturation protease n=1 Tax=Streptomyces sp. NPDC058739 TaxID=3346618 RepID=UPI00369C4388